MTAPAMYGPLVLPVAWSLAGLSLTGGPDDFGCYWSVSKARGWRGTAKPRTNRDARTTASGASRGAAYRDERIITLTGQVRCPTPAIRADTEERLAQLLPDRDDVDLWPLWRTGENGIPQVRYVELDDEIEPIPVGRSWLDWTIQLAAPDPRKFTTWESVQVGPPTAGSGGVVSTGSGVVSTGSGVQAGVSGQPALARITGGGSALNPVVYQLVGPQTDVTVADTFGSARHRWYGEIPDGMSVFVNTDDQPAYDVPGAPGPIPGYGAVMGSVNARHAVLRTGGKPQLWPGQTRQFAVVSGSMGATAKLIVHGRPTWD
ncbi:minor tail protein [Microcystis phage Mwe-JY05]